MNMVYFPFTCISERTARALYRRFGQFVVYQPTEEQVPAVLENLSVDGIVKLRCPVAGNETRLLNLCRSYTELGNVHGRELAGLTRLAASGFYNESFAAELRNEVLRGGDVSGPEEQDPVFAARLFLRLAQIFDIEQAEIARHLESTELATRQLFDELRGEGLIPGDEKKPAVPIEDSGSVMTEARISAWSLLHQNEDDNSGIFLTASPAVMEFLADRFSSLVYVGSHPGQVAEILHSLEKDGKAGIDEARQRLGNPVNRVSDEFTVSIYLLPACEPGDSEDAFFKNFCRAISGQEDPRNILFCNLTLRQ